MTSSEVPAEPMPAVRRRWPLRGWLVGLFIFLAGPPIGALLLAIPGYFIIGNPAFSEYQAPPSANQNDLQSYIAVVFIIALFSHVIGGVQVLLSAVWLGIRTYRHGTFGYGEAALVALVVSVLWSLRFGFVNGFMAWPTGLGQDETYFLEMQFTLIAVGVASALVCRWLLRVVRILP